MKNYPYVPKSPVEMTLENLLQCHAKLWQKILDEKITTVYGKAIAARSLGMDFPNNCAACLYAGLDADPPITKEIFPTICERYCPFDWGTFKFPELTDIQTPFTTKAPCEREGSPYRKWEIYSSEENAKAVLNVPLRFIKPEPLKNKPHKIEVFFEKEDSGNVNLRVKAADKARGPVLMKFFTDGAVQVYHNGYPSKNGELRISTKGSLEYFGPTDYKVEFSVGENIIVGRRIKKCNEE